MKPLTIDELIAVLGLPKGFQRVKWINVKDGDEVFLWGQHEGVAQEYGPFAVVQADNRTLFNKFLNRRFMNYGEDLLVRVAN